jgi:hypothetical protein
MTYGFSGQIGEFARKNSYWRARLPDYDQQSALAGKDYACPGGHIYVKYCQIIR